MTWGKIKSFKNKLELENLWGKKTDKACALPLDVAGRT